MDSNKPKHVLPVRMRGADQTDVSLIFSSWLKSYRNSHFARPIHPRTFYAEHHKIVGSLIQSCTTWVACDDTDPTNVYGYICGEIIDDFLVVHFIYVKHTYRNLGLATALLQQFQVHPSGISIYTHHNQVSERLAAAYHFMYNPYMALITGYRQGKTKNGLDVTEKPKIEEDADEKRKFRIE